MPIELSIELSLNFLVNQLTDKSANHCSFIPYSLEMFSTGLRLKGVSHCDHIENFHSVNTYGCKW